MILYDSTRTLLSGCTDDGRGVFDVSFSEWGHEGIHKRESKTDRCQSDCQSEGMKELVFRNLRWGGRGLE